MKATIILVFSTLLILCIACQKEDPLQNAIGQVDCASVGYAAVIKPLFDRTCGGSDCHGPGGDDGEIINYNQTKRYVNNGDIQKMVLNTREMPIGFVLTEEELGQVKCWLDGGAMNN